MFQISLTKRATKEFAKLPNKIKLQITDVIDGCIDDPWQFNYKKLKTPFQGFRIRSGQYRFLFTIEENVLTVYSIAYRKDAYRR